MSTSENHWYPTTVEDDVWWAGHTIWRAIVAVTVVLFVLLLICAWVRRQKLQKWRRQNAFDPESLRMPPPLYSYHPPPPPPAVYIAPKPMIAAGALAPPTLPAGGGNVGGGGGGEGSSTPYYNAPPSSAAPPPYEFDKM